MSSTFDIKDNVVGLIVRGKTSESHSPGVMAQHADCILPGGQPVGFFGGGGDASSGSSGSGSIGSTANGPSISFNKTGMNMKGSVAYYNDMLRIRPMYADARLAKKYKVVSTVLLLEVTKNQADLFTQYWKNLKLNPGTFHLLGANCSTHASEAFEAAKITSGGIPGLDTPDNLFKHLKMKHKGRTIVHSGHIGALPASGGKYALVIEK